MLSMSIQPAAVSAAGSSSDQVYLQACMRVALRTTLAKAASVQSSNMPALCNLVRFMSHGPGQADPTATSREGGLNAARLAARQQLDLPPKTQVYRPS